MSLMAVYDIDGRSIYKVYIWHFSLWRSVYGI